MIKKCLVVGIILLFLLSGVLLSITAKTMNDDITDTNQCNSTPVLSVRYIGLVYHLRNVHINLSYGICWFRCIFVHKWYYEDGVLVSQGVCPFGVGWAFYYHKQVGIAISFTPIICAMFYDVGG